MTRTASTAKASRLRMVTHLFGAKLVVLMM